VGEVGTACSNHRWVGMPPLLPISPHLPRVRPEGLSQPGTSGEWLSGRARGRTVGRRDWGDPGVLNQTRCHPRESGDLCLLASTSRTEVPAFAGMTLWAWRELRHGLSWCSPRCSQYHRISLGLDPRVFLNLAQVASGPRVKPEGERRGGEIGNNRSIHHGVIPAQAGIHAEGHPQAGCVWDATDMDSGLRRNDIVGGLGSDPVTTAGVESPL
jgi:hypothetical protein